MDIRAIAMGVAFAFMWASAFSSARMIVADAPPFFALTLRFLASGGIAIAIALILGQTWRLTRAQWVATVIFGICQNTLYLGLNFEAMQTIEAGLATIIASTMPLIVAFAGWVLLGQTVRPLGIAGLVAGFVGVAIIMGARLSQGIDIYGLLLCIIGVMSLAAATMLVKSASSGGNLLMIIGLQMLVGAVGLGIAALALESWVVNWNARLIWAFVYTLIVPGLIATWVWFWLVERLGAVRAATFHFLTPPFGVGVAALLLGEQLGWLDALGVAIVATGILAVQLAKAPAPT